MYPSTRHIVYTLTHSWRAVNPFSQGFRKNLPQTYEGRRLSSPHVHRVILLPSDRRTPSSFSRFISRIMALRSVAI